MVDVWVQQCCHSHILNAQEQLKNRCAGQSGEHDVRSQGMCDTAEIFGSTPILSLLGDVPRMPD